MSPSLVLCVLFLAMAYGNVEGTPYDKIKELFNYGATFEEKGTLYPSGNHWVHYFEIELQTFPFVSEKPTPCSNCPWYSEAMVEILALHRQTAVDVGTILGEIKSLLPHHSLARLPMTRRRRSFLPFIGSLAKTLFGTSTSSDLNSLSRNVALIRANQQKMAKATAHQIGIFAAAIRNFDSRIDNIFQGITDNHEAIEKLGENFNNSLISSQVAQGKLLSAMTKQTRLTLRILTRFEELLMGVLSTIQGKLSPLLIPHHTLTHVLSHIQSYIQPHGFYLTHSHPGFYYKHAKFTIFRRFSNILISVEFPITTMTLQLYKLNTFPIPVNSTTRHGTQLDSPNDHLLLSKDGKLFRETNSKDLQTCSRNGNIRHCQNHMILRNDTKRSCLLSLFNGHKQYINANCVFHFVPNVIRPSIVQLNQTHLVLINVSDITLHCENRKIVEKGCSFCILAIPCKCSLSSSSLYLDPYWNRCNKNETSKISKVHGVNLILLQQFFNKSLKALQPNSTFSKILDVQLPHFRFFTHNFTNIVESEKQSKLDLKKVALAAKENKMIFQRLSESMLDYQSNLPQTIDLPSLLAYISTALALIILLAFVFLFIKYRTLVTTVTLLSRTSEVHSYALPPVFHYTTESSITTTTFPVDITPHLYTTSEVLGILSLFLIGIFMLYKVVKKDKFKLVIELTNNDDTVLIPVVRLPYAHDGLTFLTSASLSDFKVKYGIRSFLEIDWADFAVEDSSFAQKFTMPSKILVNPVIAYRTDRIISKPFTALLYKQLGRVMYPVVITPKAESVNFNSKIYPDLHKN